MKFPKEVVEVRKNSQKPKGVSESKASDEISKSSGNALEKVDAPNCIVEPNATALIPPWIRSTLGLSEKAAKSNQRSSKVGPLSSDRNFCPETCEMRSDAEDGCVTREVYIQESCTNPIVEVNIGHEAEDGEIGGKPLPSWRSRAGKQNRCEYNIFGLNNDKRISRSLKSEVTSIDVVVPADDQALPQEERRKVRSHKSKSKMTKRPGTGHSKTQDAFKGIPSVPFRMSSREPADGSCKGSSHLGPSTMRQLDSRLLLLCGKNEVDKLTEEDVSLLQEMRNQIGHKEGIEKLFNEIGESPVFGKTAKKEVSAGRASKERAEKRDVGGDKGKRDAGRGTKAECDSDKAAHARDGSYVGKGEGGDTKAANNPLTRGKAMEEERKYFEDVRRHYEKKKFNQQRGGKHPEEGKCGAGLEKSRLPGLRNREVHPGDSTKEKKNKLRHGDLSVMEKAVNETLHKFIDMHHFQIPPSIVSTMKKNIMQALQNQYPELKAPKNNFDVMFAVQEQLKSVDLKKSDFHSLLMEEREDGLGGNLFRTSDAGVASLKGLQALPNFTGEENIVSKDVGPKTEEANVPFVSLLRSVREKKCQAENDVEEDGDVKELQRDFEKCLQSIRSQLSLVGTRLCNVILEKTEVDDLSEKKLRIFHHLSSGLTESIRMYDGQMCLGSPEGDSFDNSVTFCNCHFCDCHRLPPMEKRRGNMKCSRSSQTEEKEVTKSSTQTDWLDLLVKQLNSTDLDPGLYRVVKAAEMDRFYLFPEECVEETELMERKIPESEGLVAELCHDLSDGLTFRTYGKCRRNIFRSLSGETFLSEKSAPVITSNNTRLRRMIKSDCLGLNNIKCGQLMLGDSKKSLLNLLTENLMNAEVVPVARDAEPEKEADDKGLAVAGESDTAKFDGSKVLNSDSYHVGCVWFWNGKKMLPGVDLKVHVEDLLREKLREIFSEAKFEESGAGCREKAVPGVGGQGAGGLEASAVLGGGESAENLAVRKARAKFSIDRDRPFNNAITPFIFRGTDADGSKMEPQGPNEPEQDCCCGRSVREVGTQNSHTFVSLNITKLNTRSRLCAVAKFSRQRRRKRAFLKRSAKKTRSPFSFSEKATEAKKVKLQFGEQKATDEDREVGSTSESVRECVSIVSNESSSSVDGPVKVKLIGIEVSKEKKLPIDGDAYGNCGTGSETRQIMFGDIPSKEKLNALPRHDAKQYKHWELIENVLNRVSQKEKDNLWNDIRDFVKKKIGRDINDEGAREVCIEIEQDVPKFNKGKSSEAVVARGNYARNEGDVEVEVDLTLDDLERILRHRQRKLKRRQHYREQKKKLESKKSESSSATLSALSNEILNFHNYAGTCGGFGVSRD